MVPLWSELVGSNIVPNFILHSGTIFGPHKIPNWMWRRRLISDPWELTFMVSRTFLAKFPTFLSSYFFFCLGSLRPSFLNPLYRLSPDIEQLPNGKSQEEATQSSDVAAQIEASVPESLMHVVHLGLLLHLHADDGCRSRGTIAASGEQQAWVNLVNASGKSHSGRVRIPLTRHFTARHFQNRFQVAQLELELRYMTNTNGHY